MENDNRKIKPDKAQLEAARHLGGPCLVLAGPGSGKTAVVVERIKYLTGVCGVSPSKILVMTFSRAAADEMKERYLTARKENGAGGNCEIPCFGTFHSVFYMILKKSSGEAGKIISDSKKYAFIKTRLEAMSLEYDDEAEAVKTIAGRISSFKMKTCRRAAKENAGGGNGESKEEYEGCKEIKDYRTHLPRKAFLSIFESYEKYKKQTGLIDFDDMLCDSFALLENNAGMRAYWQNRFDYILVDEFQDINDIQYEILRLLAGGKENVFAVGDDDQSIYAFRGASPDIMRRFLSDYKNPREILLAANYRSNGYIVDASQKVICKNKNRFRKDIRCAAAKRGPDLEKNGGTGTASIKAYADRAKEYDAICAEIKECAGLSGSVAVLFRRNADFDPLIARFSAQGIKFVSKETRHGFLDGAIYKDIKAYLLIADSLRRGNASSLRRGELLRIINKPVRYISRYALSGREGTGAFEELFRFYEGNQRMLEALQRFEKDLAFMSSLTPSAAFQYLKNAAGYGLYLKETAKEKKESPERLEKRVSVVEDFLRDVKSFDELLEKENKLREHEKWEKGNKDGEKGCVSTGPEAAMEYRTPCNKKPDIPVRIMTMHASKGLEFDTVYLPDVNDSIIPGKNAENEALLEEERRLLYVAMTRARETLKISYVRKIHGKSAELSRFLI